MSTQINPLPANTTFRFKVARNRARRAVPVVAPPLPPPSKYNCLCPSPPIKPPGKPFYNPYEQGEVFDPPPMYDDGTMKGWGNFSSIGTTLSNVLPQIQASLPRPQMTTLDKFLTTGSSIGSQLIAAFGQRPTQQVSYGTPTIIPNLINQQPQQQQYYAPTQQQQQAAMQQYYAANTPGAGIGSGIDGIFDWIQQNPMIVIAGAAGFYLLMRQPPGRR
jgi:hypothetical protein